VRLQSRAKPKTRLCERQTHERHGRADSGGTGQGLTQWQRVANTFTAPSKTFDDIKQGNKSWWLPFLISIAFVYVFFAAVTVRVGWDQVAQNAIHLNPKAEAKLDQAPPEQRAMSLKFTQYAMEGGLAASPIIAIAGTAIAAVVLLGTINFVLAEEPSSGAYSPCGCSRGCRELSIPAGNSRHFRRAGTGVVQHGELCAHQRGRFLNAQDVGPALYRLATAVDVISIWTMILAAWAGAVAGVKRSSGYLAVFGWWAILTLVGVGFAR